MISDKQTLIYNLVIDTIDDIHTTKHNVQHLSIYLPKIIGALKTIPEYKLILKIANNIEDNNQTGFIKNSLKLLNSTNNIEGGNSSNNNTVEQPTAIAQQVELVTNNEDESIETFRDKIINELAIININEPTTMSKTEMATCFYFIIVIMIYSYRTTILDIGLVGGLLSYMSGNIPDTKSGLSILSSICVAILTLIQLIDKMAGVTTNILYPNPNIRIYKDAQKIIDSFSNISDTNKKTLIRNQILAVIRDATIDTRIEKTKKIAKIKLNGGKSKSKSKSKRFFKAGSKSKTRKMSRYVESDIEFIVLEFVKAYLRIRLLPDNEITTNNMYNIISDIKIPFVEEVSPMSSSSRSRSN